MTQQLGPSNPACMLERKTSAHKVQMIPLLLSLIDSLSFSKRGRERQRQRDREGGRRTDNDGTKGRIDGSNNEEGEEKWTDSEIESR